MRCLMPFYSPSFILSEDVSSLRSLAWTILASPSSVHVMPWQELLLWSTFTCMCCASLLC